MLTMAKHTRRKIQIILCVKYFGVFGIVFLNLSPRVHGYGEDAHEYITNIAIDNYIAWVNQNNDLRIGEVVANYRNEISAGSVDEDIPSTRVIDHFWDPDTGQGCLLVFGKSALQRAEELYSEALSAYEDEAYTGGDEVGAYHYLGRVIHLVEDMAVPAHTLIDWHINVWPYTPDDYETFMLSSIRFISDDQIQTGSLVNLMGTVAEVSDDYDSDNKDGETDLVNRSDGLDYSEFILIRNACFPLAIRAAGGILTLFYEDIQPTMYFSSPGQEDVCSGLGEGVSIQTVADSYNAQHNIANIEMEFCLLNENGPWSSIAELPGDTGSIYTYLDKCYK